MFLDLYTHPSVLVSHEISSHRYYTPIKPLRISARPILELCETRVETRLRVPTEGSIHHTRKPGADQVLIKVCSNSTLAVNSCLATRTAAVFKAWHDLGTDLL